MDYVEKIADKIIPWAIIVITVAGFTMYMDVQRLKEVATDYKMRADKKHDEIDERLYNCIKNDIIQSKDIEFLKSGK